MYYAFLNSKYLFPLKSYKENYDYRMKIGLQKTIELVINKISFFNEDDCEDFLENITEITNIYILEENDNTFSLGLDDKVAAFEGQNIDCVKSDFSTVTFIFYKEYE